MVDSSHVSVSRMLLPRKSIRLAYIWPKYFILAVCCMCTIQGWYQENVEKKENASKNIKVERKRTLNTLHRFANVKILKLIFYFQTKVCFPWKSLPITKFNSLVVDLIILQLLSPQNTTNFCHIRVYFSWEHICAKYVMNFDVIKDQNSQSESLAYRFLYPTIKK